jgi:outer membrane protein OmpA-like peptidoglycan-associated protein
MLLLRTTAWAQPIENTTEGKLQETHRPPNVPGNDDGSTTRTRISPPKNTGNTAAPAAPVVYESSTTTTTTATPPPRQTTPPPSSGAGYPSNRNQCEEPSRRSVRELSVFFGEGLSGLYYDINGGGTSKMNAGLNFGLAYSYFMHENVSILLGVGLSFYNTTAVLPTMYSFIGSANVLNDNLYIERYMSGYTEQQSVMTLNIPLMFSYVSDYKFYIRGGVQLGIPLRSVYTATNANIMQGYRFMLPSTNLSTLIYDGFETPNVKVKAGNFRMAPKVTDYIKTNISIILSIEAGIRLMIHPKHTLYTGVFFDYGVNNMIVNRDMIFIRGEPKDISDNLNTELINPSVKENFMTNSLLNSRQPETRKSIDEAKSKTTGNGVMPNSSFVDNTHLMAVGIKLTYSFSVTPTATTSSIGGSDAEPLSPWANISDKLDRLLASNSSKETRIERIERIETEKSSPSSSKKSVKKTTKKVTSKTRAKNSSSIRKPLHGYSPQQTNLTAEQKQELNKKANILRQNPNTKVTLHGHTSDVGGNAMDIGMKRAQGVKNYLVQKGVKSGNLSAVSHGAEKPLVPNTNPENRARNNRVEFVEK